MKKFLEKYYIAYFDILGYKAFFEDKENDIMEFLKQIIKLADDVVNKSASIFWDKFEVKSFSDNFVILLNSKGLNEYQAVKSLSYLLAYMQLRFLEKYSVLIRGGITVGDIYIDNNIIFGEGLVKAVELESGANFPRIVIDEKSIKKEVCDDLCEKCIRMDTDERYYVNFFEALETDISGEEDIYNVENHLMVLQKNIYTLLKRNGKYRANLKDPKKIAETDKTISKYIWLLTKYNDYCADGYIKYMITYDLSINYRLMKCEVIPKPTKLGK